MNACGPSRQSGVSLVECCIVTAIAAVSLGAAAPDFDRQLQRQHVEGAAAELQTDIHYLRSLAVARNQPLRLSFTSTAALKCYVIHTGSAGDCPCDAQGVAACRNGAQALRTTAFAAGSAVAVTSNSASMLFDATRGTVTPTATMRVQGRGGEALNVVVNIMGRVRACAATGGLPGHARC